MKIAVNRILPNPHRDLKRNPIRAEQVGNIRESIDRNGFWDNLVVRKSPTRPDYYELAYGHHRMAAVVEAGIDTVDLPVRDISDWSMFQAMVDENTTQATITPNVVFENIGVGAHLLEHYIRDSETCEEFKEKLGGRPARDARSEWRKDDYTKIRNAVLAGEGVGKDLIESLIPAASRSHNVVSAVLESIYGERRKAAAAKKAQEAQEASRKAEADRKAAQAESDRKAAEQRKADEAAAAAARAAKEAEKLDAKRREAAAADKRAADKRAADARHAAMAAEREAKARDKEAREARELEEERKNAAAKLARTEGVDEKILRSFESPRVMADFTMLVKRLNIPAKHHKAAADAVAQGEWSTRTMAEKLPVWWDDKSGAAAERMKKLHAEMERWKFNKAYNGGNFNNFCHDYIRDLSKLDHRTDVLRDNIAHGDKNLRKTFANDMREWAARFLEIAEAAGSPDAVRTVDITPAQPKMLTHR